MDRAQKAYKNQIWRWPVAAERIILCALILAFNVRVPFSQILNEIQPFLRSPSKKLKLERKEIVGESFSFPPSPSFSVVSFETCFLKQKLNKWILLSSLSVVSSAAVWDEINCQALSSAIISSAQLSTPTALRAVSASTNSMWNGKSLLVPHF